MKTKNNNQKTFENQTGRKILFGCSILVGLGLISLTGQTQEYFNQFFAKDSYSNLAIVLSDQVADFEIPSIRFSTGNTAVNFDFSGATETFMYEQDQDAVLNIEDWMTDETSFFSAEEFIAGDVEKDLDIEDWMINNSNFNTSLNVEIADQEQELEIEDWMTMHSCFRNAVDCESVDQEEALRIEPWMTNVDLFTSAGTEKSLNIESWMIDCEVFKSNSIQVDHNNTEATHAAKIAQEL